MREASLVLFIVDGLASDGLERLLESADEVRNVTNRPVLVLVSRVHFLLDISLVLLEFANRVGLDLLNSLLLPRQLVVELGNELVLHLLSLFLLEQDGFLDLTTLVGQVLKDLPLLGDASVFLRFEVAKVLGHLRVQRVQVVVQSLDSVTALFREHVFEVLHAIVATLVLILLVLILSIEFVTEL